MSYRLKLQVTQLVLKRVLLYVLNVFIIVIDDVFCSKNCHITNHAFGYGRRGVVVSGVRRMNEVNARRARLVPGWVTVSGRVYHLGMYQAN